MYVYIILQVLSMYVYAIYYMYVYKYRCVRVCVCVCVCVCLSGCLAVWLSVWLSGCLAGCLSVCLSVCLPAVCHVCKKQPRDRLLVDFSRFFVVFWYDLIWFWYGCDTIVRVNLFFPKLSPNHWGIRISSPKASQSGAQETCANKKRLNFHGSIQDPIKTSLTHIKNHNWNHIKVITEPYQNHNCKTRPENHNNKSYLNHIKIIKLYKKYF